jgi:polyhydroxybutyrate depolymerase
LKRVIQCSVPAFALLLFCAALAGGQGATRETAGTITHAGQERTYLVHVPASYDGKKALPLVLALHGGGASGRSMIGLAKLNELADRHGFLVAYPDGVNRRWKRRPPVGTDGPPNRGRRRFPLRAD